MASNEKTSEYAVTADASGYEAGMKRAMEASREASKQIGNSFSSISSMVGKLTGVMGALTAVVAGGAAFSGAIKQANAWNGEAKKLSMQLGVTTEKASVMMVAMRHLGIDSELMGTAAAKLSKQVFSNAGAFEKLGVKVKDANGEYRPTTELMGEVNEKLKAIKNPIEQNIAGMQVYGKGWQEIRGTLKLTSAELAKAELQAKSLNLIVGDEGVAQSRKYKEAMNDMGLVTTSLAVQFGSAVLPSVVALGSWLGGIGPTVCKGFTTVMASLTGILGTCWDTIVELGSAAQQVFAAIGGVISSVMGVEAPGAMEFFANVLKVVEVAFVGLRVAVEVSLWYVGALIDNAIAKIQRFASVADRALHWDWAGTKAAWEDGTRNIEAVHEKHLKKLIAITADGKKRIDDIMNRGPKKPDTTSTKDTTGGPNYDFDNGSEKKVKSRMAEWEAKLAIDKDGFEKAQQLAGTDREFSKAAERDFWKNVLATVKMTAEEKIQVTRKYLGLEHDVRKEAFDAELAGEKAKMENYTHDIGARIGLANQMYDKLKDRYGEDSKEARAAMGEIAKEQKKLEEQTLATSKVVSDARRNLALADIDAEQRDADLLLQLHALDEKKMLELDAMFENRRFAIKEEALRAELALLEKSPDRNPVALAQIHAQIEGLESAHQAKLAEIRGKATLTQNKNMTDLYGSMQSGLQGVLADTARGTLSLSGMFKGLMSVVVNSVTDMLAKTAAQWVMNMVLEKTMSKVSAMSQISANAGIAGAAATASAASIPGIGWMIAPQAGIAASAAAMAYMPMASARNGFDIPAGLNPVTQLHEREMVLPQKQADAVRDMADGKGGGGGDYHIHISAVDSKSVERLFRENGRHLVGAIQEQRRNFAPGTK